MNALWITRFSAYKQTPQHIESAKELIGLKIARQNVLLKRYHRKSISITTEGCESIEDVLLHEARAAKQYWHEFQLIIPEYATFHRQPHAPDIANQLLDIGYHHLTNKVKKILERLNIPGELGLLHVARASKSVPLAYDLVELFRADIVDTHVAHFLRQKKVELHILTQSDIAHFIHILNKACAKMYYLKDFKQCHAYSYYMELQIVKFCKAINHREVFNPLHLPARHDTRCLTQEKNLL